MLVNFLLIPSFLIYVNCLDESPSILIIGAGPSGIAAATKLYTHNFTNLKILEAENRIGGRIRSVKFGDAFVDLGAEWCHGEQGNVVYNMVKEYDILSNKKNFSLHLFYSNGEKISEDISNDWQTFIESVYTDPHQNSNCENASSVGECFHQSFNAIFPKKYKTDPQKIKLSLEAVDFMEDYITGYESAFSWYDVTVETGYEECEGRQDLNWNGKGYKTILDVMLQKYPDPTKAIALEDKLLLNKEVVKIDWKNTSTGKPLVRCSDNSNFNADFVIVTPSVGVLKANVDMFTPKLPEEKIKAIAGIGFGAVMKVLLHFPTAWYQEQDLFGFVWNSKDKINVSNEFPEGPIKNGKSWITVINLIHTAENNPNVLVVWITGDLIPEIEKTPDDIIKNGIMFVIRKFLGRKYNIIESDQMIRTSWYTNPHFRGTYSYDAVKGQTHKNKYHEKLGTPLVNENGKYSVLFAGEASHPHHFSTVHGAIEAGYREAGRIINLYK